MAFKEFVLHNSQTVTIYKRRSSRSLRLSVTATGQIRVTIPTWTPYRAGLEFARSRQGWIAAHLQPTAEMKNGQPIGKAHHIRLIEDGHVTKTASRISASEIIIRHPLNADPLDVQRVAQSAAKRALRSQAEKLLPQRLQSLAQTHDFTYKSVAVRQLKSRWGSCDQTGHIVLNIFLLQLPWELIDYVLLHELTHTRILRHGGDFWHAMEKVYPATRTSRKEIKKYQPVFNSSVPALMA